MKNINLELSPVRLVHFANFEILSRKNIDEMIKSSKEEKSCYDCVEAGRELTCNCIQREAEIDKIPHEHKEGWLSIATAQKRLKKATEDIIKDLGEVSLPIKSTPVDKEQMTASLHVNPVEIIN
jgi:hypothetical protein